MQYHALECDWPDHAVWDDGAEKGACHVDAVFVTQAMQLFVTVQRNDAHEPQPEVDLRHARFVVCVKKVITNMKDKVNQTIALPGPFGAYSKVPFFLKDMRAVFADRPERW